MYTFASASLARLGNQREEGDSPFPGGSSGALAEARLSEQTQPAKYIRCCPTHRRELVWRDGVPYCPGRGRFREHRVDAWWVLDVERDRIVAAASLYYTLLAFDAAESLADLDVLASRRQMPAARESLDEVTA